MRPRLPSSQEGGCAGRTTMGWILLAAILPLLFCPGARSEPIETGQGGPSYGLTGNSTPTGEKPEHKLWWNDGAWWGCLYNDSVQENRIHRLDATQQLWVDTGVALDRRNGTKADHLWDGNKLYVVSHFFTTRGKPTSSGWGSLLRYSYDRITGTYSLDTGFPVDVTLGKSETLTLAKDSTGRLWVTYIEDNRVLVNHSLGDHRQWGTPFALPVDADATLTSDDDIAAIVAFQGNKIGILWSNERTAKVHFAVHWDVDPPAVWQPVETALPLPGDAALAWADDHLSVKTSLADGSGRVFAVAKTSLSGSSSPLVVLLVRSATGAWTRHVVANGSTDHTRSILQIDEENGLLHVFSTAPTSGGAIYLKTSGMQNVQFAPGVGTPFIRSFSDLKINNATAMNQNLSSRTGMTVLASDQVTRRYLYNHVAIPPNPAAPRIDGLAPASGGVGSEVVLTGVNLSGVTRVTFQGTASSGFSIDSATQIRAIVPAGAASGPISVSNGVWSTWSVGRFDVLRIPSISSFSPSTGHPGASVTINGSGFLGLTQVQFNWTPSTFTVVSDTEVTAVVPEGATSGSIQVIGPVGNGVSAGIFQVTMPPTSLNLTPRDDALVNSTRPDRSYGSSTTLRARGGGEPYRSFLKFEVAGAMGGVQSAVLRLFVTDPSPDGGAVFLAENERTDTGLPWDEGSLTWNNAPGPGTPLANVGVVALGEWVEMDVTVAILGDGTYSFALASTSSNSVLYSSKEGSHPPELALQFGP